MSRTSRIVATVVSLSCLTLSACDSEETGGRDPHAEGDAPRPAMLSLGEGAMTSGFTCDGRLRITPESIVYSDQIDGIRPEGEAFAIVSFQAEAVSDNPTCAVAEKGESKGFKWRDTAGSDISEVSGADSRWDTLEGFADGRRILAGTYSIDNAVFDIDKSQKQSTLVYIDSNGQEFRWRMPAKDAGRTARALRMALTP